MATQLEHAATLGPDLLIGRDRAISYNVLVCLHHHIAQSSFGGVRGFMAVVNGFAQFDQSSGMFIGKVPAISKNTRIIVQGSGE